MTETRAHDLLQAVYAAGRVAPFDFAAEAWADDADPLAAGKAAADLLVAMKLARYADDGRTVLEPTNAGRYWALHGGYLAFLKEEPPAPGRGGPRSPEAEALRTTYMALRLKTFWWSFGMSVAGFVLSIISLAVALTYGDRLLAR